MCIRDRDNPGTIIINEIKDKDKDNEVITGIAGKKDFTAISIYKNHMSDEVGIVRKALSVFERYRVSIEHIPVSYTHLDVYKRQG